MANTYNTVLDALAAELTSYLQETYSPECMCSRDPFAPAWSSLQPEQTPYVWLIQDKVEVEGEPHWIVQVAVSVLCYVRRDTPNASESSIPTLLGELQDMLDRLLWEATVMGNVKISVELDGAAEHYIAENDGFIAYPVRIQFARKAAASY